MGSVRVKSKKQRASQRAQHRVSTSVVYSNTLSYRTYTQRYQTYHIWITYHPQFQWLHAAREVLVLAVTRINLASLHAQVLCEVQPKLALESQQEMLMLHATFHSSNLVIKIMFLQSRSRYCYWKHMILLKFLLQFRKPSSMCLLWCLIKN